MRSQGQRRIRMFEINSRALTIALTLTLLFALLAVLTPAAQAQYTFKVLHNFSGGQDGATPYAGVTMDGAGNLYGTAWVGGIGAGTVYQLKLKNSSFVFNPLFSFDGSDGANPRARVIFGPNSTLYGTTANGGAGSVGTVFNLRPPASAPKSAVFPWNESVLYSFVGYPTDGANPGYGDLTFDQGNIYGTTLNGGDNNIGVVYELTPKGSGYTESLIYQFSGNDGANPDNGVILDSAGNLYGTTYAGGLANYGTVFELMYPGPTQCTLWNFRDGSDGGHPTAGLIFDGSGNLYGATTTGGTGGGGTVFELTSSGNCAWTLKTLYSFTGAANCGPYGTLSMDGAGNLYGTTKCDGMNNAGNVWELQYPNWIYTSLYDFTGGNDGGNPFSTVEIDPASGNLYGTASTGGTQGVGVVWELKKN
jgi:uncharacterized repeat protein (TIGR03803 family)